MAALGGLRSFALLFRFYQAAIVNTVFGFGCYALLVRLGLDIYLAQLIAHFTGVAFNYLVYSRHVFRDAPPAKLRFVFSYIGNYLLSLAVFALAASIFVSPYIAGLVAIITVSLLNFLVLKHLVFIGPKP